MNKKNDFHLHGDFNLHFNKPNEFYVSKMLTLLKDHGLNQLVDTPTQRCGNILDWIIVRADSSLLSYDCVRELPGLSDHYGIFSVLSIETLKPSFRQIKYRNIKDIQMEIFQQQIHQSAQKIYIKYTDCKDPSELAEITNKCLADILDQHAPLLSKVVKDRPPAPWKTSEVKEAKRIARRAERKYRKSGLTIDREISIEKSKASVKMINKSRKDYYSSEINSCSTSKQVFSISDSLLGKSKSKQLPNDLPMSQLPETFSQYFVDKIKNIRQELDNSTNSSLSVPIFESYNGPMFKEFSLICEADLKKLILSMPNKSCSLDPLPTSLLKSLLPELLPLLTLIINTSLKYGEVPASFKQALVVPLLKKNNLDTNILKNYRPISNLPFLSKVLERVVLQQLQNHLKENELLGIYQSAYRTNHSTETAVLNVVDNLLLKNDEHKISLMACLDLSAAFDTLDHKILLQRLKISYGVHGNVLKWFTSYIESRSQFISLDSYTSSRTTLEFGVPQGSVLGPVLFTLYAQPLSHVIVHNDCLHHNYADDTEVTKSSDPQNLEETKDGMNGCVRDISNWMEINKLKLNPEKTELMIISTKHNMKKINEKHINIKGVDVPVQQSLKYLGVRLDSTMSMTNQVSSICRACYYEIRRISSIKKFLSSDALKTLVVSRVLSRLDYCNSIFVGMSEENFKRLQLIQNSAARLILHKRKRDHVTPLLRELHWLPVRARCIYKIAVLVFRYFEGTLPTYLSNSLSPYQTSRFLRSTSHKLLNVPTYKMKNQGSRSFSIAGPKIWNDLPMNLRKSATFSIFKKNLKTYLFEKYLND